MACCMDGAKPLSELMLTYIWNSNIFIQENAFEHVVYEMAAILSRGRGVDMQSCWDRYVQTEVNKPNPDYTKFL